MPLAADAPPRGPEGGGVAMFQTDDTIVAISTAAGDGARAIVRLSGPDALSLAAGVFQPAGGNLGETLNTANHTRTFLMYHEKPHQYPAAAWMGNRLPSDPGSSTWKFKTLAGVDFTKLTATEATNLDANKVNRISCKG